jgi:hypothetical protein
MGAPLSGLRDCRRIAGLYSTTAPRKRVALSQGDVRLIRRRNARAPNELSIDWDGAFLPPMQRAETINKQTVELRCELEKGQTPG